MISKILQLKLYALLYLQIFFAFDAKSQIVKYR